MDCLPQSTRCPKASSSHMPPAYGSPCIGVPTTHANRKQVYGVHPELYVQVGLQYAQHTLPKAVEQRSGDAQMVDMLQSVPKAAATSSESCQKRRYAVVIKVFQHTDSLGLWTGCSVSCLDVFRHCTQQP